MTMSRLDEAIARLKNEAEIHIDCIEDAQFIVDLRLVLAEMPRLRRVAEAAKHFAAAGYAEPCAPWRQEVLDALAALGGSKAA
jgi:hypothetical protein